MNHIQKSITAAKNAFIDECMNDLFDVFDKTETELDLALMCQASTNQLAIGARKFLTMEPLDENDEYLFYAVLLPAIFSRVASYAVRIADGETVEFPAKTDIE